MQEKALTTDRGRPLLKKRPRISPVVSGPPILRRKLYVEIQLALAVLKGDVGVQQFTVGRTI